MTRRSLNSSSNILYNIILPNNVKSNRAPVARMFCVGYNYPMGLFGISEDYLEKVLSLDELLIKDRVSTFFFEAGDESMAPAINKGDILVVDRAINPQCDDIVILAYEGELVVRRIGKIESGVGYLADNIEYNGLIESDNVIWGVVTSAVRRFK